MSTINSALSIGSARSFTNEMGSNIMISIAPTSEAAIQGKPAMRLLMEGPRSVSENIITAKEACMLRDVLNEWHAATYRE